MACVNTAVAVSSELTKLLHNYEDLFSSCCKSCPVELSKKMFQMSILSDSEEYSIFTSLDHSRVDPRLQVRYLLRLFSRRVSEDESVWENFMILLDKMGETEMCGYFSELTSDGSIEEYHCKTKRHCLDTSLNNEDAPWILEALHNCRNKWKEIAIVLLLTDADIEDCKKSNSILSLNSVLSFWLARGTSTSLGVTLKTLVTALRTKIVGESRVAQELEDKHKYFKQISSTLQLKTSNSSLSLTDQSYDVEVADGKSTLLHVQASPKTSVCYQWKKDGQSLANSCTYYGVNEDILVVSHASQGTEGEYTCCVSCGGSEECSNKITLTVLYPPAKKLLLDLYSIHREVPPDSWPPVGTKSFINLTVAQSTVEDSYAELNSFFMNKRVEVEYSDIFGNYKSQALIVTKGRPGSGKTTLVHKIIKDWSKSVALKNAKYVFLITLRIIGCNTAHETLSSVLEVFYHNEEELRRICEEIEEGNGERVCFIIDGLDEYHPQDRNNSLIYKLLDKTFLPLAMVIVTSRPVAISNIKKEIICQTVEVLGFKEEQIIEYIDSFPFASSCDSHIATTYPTKLKEYLLSHPNVFNMCYLPVHAAMICFLFKHQKGNIPSTQTKVYQEFVRSTILRHLRRKNSKAQVRSLFTIRGRTKIRFNRLCHLAFTMTVNKTQVATQELMGNELCDYVNGDSDEWCLGLVTVNHIAELSGMTTAYSFLHLTLQEFLTAYYITRLDLPLQIISLAVLISIDIQVILFYFGLVKFESRPLLKLFFQSSVPLLSLSFPLTSSWPLSYFPYHCAFESQQEIVCDEVGYSCMKWCMRNCKHSFFLHPTPSDLDAISYVMLNTSHSFTKFTLFKSFDYANFFNSISGLNFSSLQELVVCGVFNNEAPALSALLESCTSVKTSILGLFEISYDSAKAIADKFKYLTSLQDFSVACSSTSGGGMTTLLSGLAHLTNTKLNLEFTDMDSSVVIEIGSSLQFFKCDVNIHSLLFFECNINVDAAIALANGLHSTHPSNIPHNRDTHHCLTQLRQLRISHCNIGCDVVITLTNQLQYLAGLETLDLSHNNIGPRGVVNLTDVLHYLTKLQSLILHHNNIDLTSAINVINASKKCLCLLTIDFKDKQMLARRRGIDVEGLVTPEDYTAIADLMVATQHPTEPRWLHLGFKSICIKPLTCLSLRYVDNSYSCMRSQIKIQV